MIFADRKYDCVYATRLSPCAECGGKLIGRDLYTVMGWHESLTFFEGDRLCRALGSRVPLFTLLPRRKVLENPYSALRIVMRLDRGQGPSRAPITKVVNTTCSVVG